jgi:biofilm PGA synthesis protein PgaD
MMDGSSDNICIDSPELLTERERLRDTLATGFMWMLYVYLWLPLISLLAWVMGFEFAYDVMVRAGGAAGLETVLFWYAVAITTILIAFGTWSLSNRWRYGSRNRRKAHDPVTDPSYMAYFGISAGELAQLRSGRCLALELDSAGGIGEIADGRSGGVVGQGARRRQQESRDND